MKRLEKKYKQRIINTIEKNGFFTIPPNSKYFELMDNMLCENIVVANKYDMDILVFPKDLFKIID